MLTLHDKEVNKEGFAIVANVADNMEFEMIKALLDEEGIKILDKRSGSGAYLNVILGFNYQGIDVLVHESDYEKASDILLEFSSAQVDGIAVDDETWVEEVKSTSDQSRKWFLNLFFLIPVIILGLVLLASSLNR